MHLRWIAVLALAATFVVGCGEDEDSRGGSNEAASTNSTASNRCEKVPPATVAKLEAGLDVSGKQPNLPRVRAVRSRDEGTAPGLESGTYYIAAPLKAVKTDRILTWGASRDFVQDGDGLVVGLGAVTRGFSLQGAGVNPDALKLGAKRDGFRQAVACVK